MFVTYRHTDIQTYKHTYIQTLWLPESLDLLDRETKNGVNLKRFPERAHQAIPTVEKFLFFIPSRVNGNGN